MDPRSANPSAGQRLKALRVRLGLSTRDVQAKSQQIAAEKHNQEYYLSHAWLTDIEKGKFTPGIFKLYSLSAIYHRRFSEIASYFGLQIADLSRDSASSVCRERTSLIALEMQKSKTCRSLSNSSPTFGLRKRIFWQGLLRKGTKCRWVCCNISICASRHMATLALRISPCIRSFAPGLWYRLMRGRERSVP